MKAASFAYVKPKTLSQVFTLLESEPEAKLLAGGQSLMPMLNLRLADVPLLIDLGAITGLNVISIKNNILSIGAMVRHVEIENSNVIAKYAPLLSKSVHSVAHTAIRNRGTIGGSVALADPAAEYPAVLLALNATMVLNSKSGERRVAAIDFFEGIYATAIQEGEVLTSINIPLYENSRFAFHELARRHGDYAQCGLAAFREGSNLNLSYFSMSYKPVLAMNAASALLNGQSLTQAQAALGDDLDPADQLDCSAKAKMQFARVLLKRAALELGFSA